MKRPKRWSSTTRNCEPVRTVYLNPEKISDGQNMDEVKEAA